MLIRALGVAALVSLGLAGLVAASAVRANADRNGILVPVGDREIYVEESGRGTPLLLLHYFGGCTRSWDPHVAELSRHYRVIAADLPGHGRSTGASEAFSHRQAARDVFAVLDSMGIRRFHAMGISSGGMTLLHMATSKPERVDAMVLIGATSYFPEQARAIMRQSTPELLPEAEQQAIASCSSRGQAQTLEIIRQFNRMQHSVDDMNFTPPLLATIQARTLIVHGDRDEFFPPAIPLEIYQAVPDSALWIVPNGSHIPIFGENGESFRREALAFLRANQRDRFRSAARSR